MSSAAAYIARLAAHGQHHFSTSDAQAALGSNRPAVDAALLRLKKQGQIATPHRGFHVIVPPEYRNLGCLPAEQFVPQLMDHLAEVYYAALLSAAQIHGAAHHRPQQFQVMVAKNRRPIVCGKVQVTFVARGNLANTPVIQMNTPRGFLRVSSPEATALELVGYAGHCGGLDTVAGVLEELMERVEMKTLSQVARSCPVAWSQRLGYLLDLLGFAERIEPLAAHVQVRARTTAPLVRSRSTVGAPCNARWKLAINAQVEPDL